MDASRSDRADDDDDDDDGDDQAELCNRLDRVSSLANLALARSKRALSPSSSTLALHQQAKLASSRLSTSIQPSRELV